MPLITGTVALSRQLVHHLVIQQADHDGIDIARQHARGVGHGLPAAELHFLPVSMIVLPPSCRMATSKEMRVRVECLSKIIASILPASGVGCAPRAVRPSGAAARDRPRRTRRGRVDQIEKMPHAVAGSCAATVFGGPRMRLREPRASPIDSRDRLATRSPMISGGSRRTTLSPAPTTITGSLRVVDQFGLGGTHLQTEHQALPAHFLEHRRVAARAPASCWCR